MPQYFLVRLLTFATALLIPAFLPVAAENRPHWLLLPMLLTHYLLAIPYSKRQIGLVLKQKHTTFKLVGLVVVSALLFAAKIPNMLYYLFAFHYVFSEVYLLHDRLFKDIRTQTRALRASSIIFNALAYFMAIGLLRFPEPVQIALLAGYLISGLVWAASLFKLRKILSPRQIISSCIFETFALAIVCVSLYISPIALLSFIFYHVLFWFFYPSLKMMEARQFKPLAKYVGLNVALTSMFVLVAPELNLPIHLSTQQYIFLFYFGSVTHIMTTMSMSNSQPGWLTKFFNPELLTPAPVQSQQPIKELALSST